jgi:hypothetical protein
LYQAFSYAFPNFTQEAFELETLSLFDYVPDKVIDRMTDEQVREAFNIPEAEIPEVQAVEGQSAELNEALTNLTGRQFQNIQRTVRKYNKGEISSEQAKQLLMGGFGMTEDQAGAWIIEESEEDGADS